MGSEINIYKHNVEVDTDGTVLKTVKYGDYRVVEQDAAPDYNLLMRQFRDALNIAKKQDALKIVSIEFSFKDWPDDDESERFRGKRTQAYQIVIQEKING